MNTIAQRLQQITTSILHSQRKCEQRRESLDEILLVAVSKTQPASAIREAFLAGQKSFGENYLQEALTKQQALKDLNIDWHFIGPIQSNKTKPIAENFNWVHGVDRLKIAERLNVARPASLPPLNICIQLNVSDEDTKSGVTQLDLLPLALAIKKLTNLKLRGLMAIPSPTIDVALQHAQFKLVRDCYDKLNNNGLELDTLSMGMSKDYQVAIEEAATIVRIGSAIFGDRPINNQNNLIMKENQ